MSLLRGANVLNDNYFVFLADDDERLRRVVMPILYRKNIDKEMLCMKIFDM